MYKTENSVFCFSRELHADLAVVGGGLSGVIAAVAAAREGVKTILVHDRPVLGGPSGSECSEGNGKMVCGAYNYCNRNAREAGLMEELRNFHSRRYVYGWRNHWSLSLRELVEQEKNITLLMNCSVYDCRCENNLIKCAFARQGGSEMEFVIYADNFVDASGDGALGFKAGAEFRMGREGKDEFDEPMAPDVPDEKTMGTSICFRAVDVGHPIKFEAPSWAYKINSDEDLPHRLHNNPVSGYWWLEYGGEVDTIADNEEIYRVLRSVLFGMWDHVKNGGDHGAENYAINWVAAIGGKRESRRFMGDHIMNQRELTDHPEHPDTVAYGGWPIDVHPPEGVFGKGHPGSTPPFIFPGLFPIPFRSLYSRNIHNMMMAGRNISVTHIALGSTRLMATCALTGQAVGTAAALLKKYNCRPRELYQNHIVELRQLLQKRDAVNPGYPVVLPDDLARSAKISADSTYIWQMEDAEKFIPVKAIDTPTKKFDPCDVAPDDRRVGMKFLWNGKKLQSISFKLRNHASKPLPLTLRLRSEFFSETDIAVAGQNVMPGETVVSFTFDLELPAGSYAMIFDDQPELEIGTADSHRPGFERKLDGCYLNYDHFVCTFIPELTPYVAGNTVNDNGRSVEGKPSLWMADSESGELSLQWDEAKQLREVDLVFDTNLDRFNLDRIAPECVKAFVLEADGREIYRENDNSKRFVRCQFSEVVAAEKLTLKITQTNGDKFARLVAIRCF